MFPAACSGVLAGLSEEQAAAPVEQERRQERTSRRQEQGLKAGPLADEAERNRTDKRPRIDAAGERARDFSPDRGGLVPQRQGIEARV